MQLGHEEEAGVEPPGSGGQGRGQEPFQKAAAVVRAKLLNGTA